MNAKLVRSPYETIRKEKHTAKHTAHILGGFSYALRCVFYTPTLKNTQKQRTPTKAADVPKGIILYGGARESLCIGWNHCVLSTW